MLNIPIDQHASILQAYYDSGESYVGHHKYSINDTYTVTPSGSLSQAWDGARIYVKPGEVTVLTRDGVDVDVSGYNRFRLFGIIPSTVRVRLYCNGEKVMDDMGPGRTSYLDGTTKITHSHITSIRYEFETDSDKPTTVSLHYLGMLSDTEASKSPFTDEWEGFFSDKPDYGIYRDYLISEDELNALREKIKHEPYKTAYESYREVAFKAMQEPPEAKITRTMYKHHREPMTISGTTELAIVGQIEGNKDMLHMACRYALSLASCEYWCADVMETIPMVTWHHRAFTESYVTQFICTVIWLAGGLLSWHGRNYLYNSIIMKGFPRIEADFMTMDYIYHCNQGVSFMHGYMQGLITVSDEYPRYKARINEAREILDNIYDNIFGSDGSFEEGAMYWDYTFRHYLPTAYFISRYDGKTFRESAGDKLRLTANYGISILGDNGNPVPFGDCGQKLRYNIMIPALMYSVTGDDRWATLLPMTKPRTITEMVIAASVDVPHSNVPISGGFNYFEKIGMVKVQREGILFASIAGPSNDTHCHGDKGSFVIYKDGVLVVPDFYASYYMAEAVVMNSSMYHSLAVPVVDDEYIEQHRGKKYTSVVEKVSCENGIFEWKCNNSDMWDSTEVTLNCRTVYSDKPNEFTITDEFEFSRECQVEFKTNFKNEADIEIIPVNWEPVSNKTVALCNINGDVTYQKQLLSHKLTSCRLETRIIIN